MDTTTRGALATQQIVRWRYERLRGAGIEVEPARRLSRDRRLDIHALIELVERGCPPDLAARIVAPLDAEEGSR